MLKVEVPICRSGLHAFNKYMGISSRNSTFSRPTPIIVQYTFIQLGACVDSHIYVDIFC